MFETIILVAENLFGVFALLFCLCLFLHRVFG